MAEIVQKYFSSLFTSNMPLVEDWDLIFDQVCPMINSQLMLSYVPLSQVMKSERHCLT